MAVLQTSRAVVRLALSLLLALAVLWAAAALWVDGPESRALAGGLLLIAVMVAVVVRPWRRPAFAVSVPFLVVLAWWLMLAPSNDRDWQPDVARLPTCFARPRISTRRTRPSPG
jgi:hypothetical protein